MKKKILIIDETRFSRICSAILEKEGYDTSAFSDTRSLDTELLNNDEFGLVITSYPYGKCLFDQLKRLRIPTIILSDNMNRDLVSTLEHFDRSRSHCLIKPLDYDKFKALVNLTMRNDGIYSAQQRSVGS
jgi:DNA-binding NtrC family response regulator